MAELTKATSTEDVLKDYDKGMNFYALSDKYGVPLETIRTVVETQVPDADGFKTIQPDTSSEVVAK